MLTWHIEPHADHRALVCRGYVPGTSYAARDRFVAVCTAFIDADGLRCELSGMLVTVRARLADFVALLTELRLRYGIARAVAERCGQVAEYDTETGRRLTRD